MDAAVTAAWAGVGVAFLAVALSYYQTRQNGRAVAVAERQAAVAEAALPPPPPPVGWEIRSGGPQAKTWAMVNIGTEVAREVEIDQKRAPSVIRAEKGPGPVWPGASIPLINATTLGQPTLREIWVRWEGQPEWVPVPMPPGWN